MNERMRPVRYLLVLGAALALAGASLLVREAVRGENRNTSYYREGVAYYVVEQDAKKAILSFHKVSSKDKQLYAAASYNEGTLLALRALSDPKISLRQRFELLSSALAKLREVIEMNPQNEEAKWNYELLREVFREVKRQVGPQSTNRRGKNNKNNFPAPHAYGPGVIRGGF